MSEQPGKTSHLEGRIERVAPRLDPTRLPAGYDDATVERIRAGMRAGLRARGPWRAPAAAGLVAAAGLAIAAVFWMNPVPANPSLAGVTDPRDVNADGAVNILDAHKLALSATPVLADGTTPRRIRDAVVLLGTPSTAAGTGGAS